MSTKRPGSGRLALLVPGGILLGGVAAVAYVVTVGHLPLGSQEVWPPLAGALISGGIGLCGMIVAGVALAHYDSEDAQLDSQRLALQNLARQICKSVEQSVVEETGAVERTQAALGGKDKASQTPLLARRLMSLLRAIRRGAPLLETDYARSEDRHFPGPERLLRTLMDIALNVGIAGTFLSLLLTFAQRNTSSLTAETLLSHLGPGLISGMAGVFCNVALRVCHTLLQKRQDDLAERVDELLADDFVHLLPKILTSSEERLADAVRQHVDKIGHLLTTQLETPINAIKQQTTLLAASANTLTSHSGAWGQTAAAMHNAVNQLLTQTGKQQAATLAAMDQFVLNYEARATSHQKELKKWAEDLLTKEQRTRQAQHQEQIAAALVAYNKAAQNYLGQVSDHVKKLIAESKEGFAAAIQDSLADSLSESASLVDELRGEAAKLAVNLDQIGKAIQRQSEAQQTAAEIWQAREQGGQERWERLLTAAQSAQEQLNAEWKRSAEETLRDIRAALESAATGVRTGNEAVMREMQGLQERVAAVVASLHQTEEALTKVTALLAGATGELSSQVSGTQVNVRTLNTTLQQAAQSVHATGTSIKELRTPVEALKEPIIALAGPMNALKEPIENLKTPLQALKEPLLGLNDPIIHTKDQAETLAAAIKAFHDAIDDMQRGAGDTYRQRETVMTEATHNAVEALKQMQSSAVTFTTQLNGAGEAIRRHGESLVPYSPSASIPADATIHKAKGAASRTKSRTSSNKLQPEEQ